MDAFILSLDKTEKYSNRRVVFITIYIKAVNFDGGTTFLIIENKKSPSPLGDFNIYFFNTSLKSFSVNLYFLPQN